MGVDFSLPVSALPVGPDQARMSMTLAGPNAARYPTSIASGGAGGSRSGQARLRPSYGQPCRCDPTLRAAMSAPAAQSCAPHIIRADSMCIAIRLAAVHAPAARRIAMSIVFSGSTRLARRREGARRHSHDTNRLRAGLSRRWAAPLLRRAPRRARLARPPPSAACRRNRAPARQCPLPSVPSGKPGHRSGPGPGGECRGVRA